MKLSTTITFNHRLFAPKGCKFEATQEQLEQVFGSDCEVEIVMDGNVVIFKEIHWNNCEDITSEDWMQICSSILVKE